MPGYDAHYLYGISSYRAYSKVCVAKTDEEECLRKIIKDYKNFYVVGLMGPDPFFYSIPETVRKGRNIGSIMHTDEANNFFRNMFRYAAFQPDAESMYKAVAYICGFLGHYTLDVAAHPYIYARTGYVPGKKDKEYISEHFKFETQIDITLVKEMTDLTPNKFKNSTFKASISDLSFIADMLVYAVNRTYARSLKKAEAQAALISMSFESRATRITSQGVKNGLGAIEKKIFGRKYISELMPGDNSVTFDDPLNKEHATWANPWAPENESDKSFYDLMDSAKEEMLRLLALFNDAFDYNDPKMPQLRGMGNEAEHFLTEIGNKSYHSGLPEELGLG